MGKFLNFNTLSFFRSIYQAIVTLSHRRTKDDTTPWSCNVERPSTTLWSAERWLPLCYSKVAHAATTDLGHNGGGAIPQWLLWRWPGATPLPEEFIRDKQSICGGGLQLIYRQIDCCGRGSTIFCLVFNWRWGWTLVTAVDQRERNSVKCPYTTVKIVNFSLLKFENSTIRSRSFVLISNYIRLVTTSNAAPGCVSYEDEWMVGFEWMIWYVWYWPRSGRLIITPTQKTCRPREFNFFRFGFS